MIYDSMYLYFASGAIVLGALLLSYKMKKTYPLPYLTYYFYYLLFFYLGNMAARPVRIMMMEILKLEGWQAQKYFVIHLGFFTGPIFVIGFYFLIKFMVCLVEKEMSRVFKVVFFSYWGVVFVSRFILMVDFFKTREGKVLWTSGYITDLLSIVFLSMTFAYAVFKSKHIKDAAKGEAVRNFGLIYLFCFAFFNVSDYFTGRTVVFLMSFLYPVPPLIYLYIHLKTYSREHAALPGDEAVMGALFSKYNISPREQEIIQLISKGKSNKEIAEVLYISLQTVKHHTHSVYRKLNVKNRVQLSNFIRNAVQ